MKRQEKCFWNYGDIGSVNMHGNGTAISGDVFGPGSRTQFQDSPVKLPKKTIPKVTIAKKIKSKPTIKVGEFVLDEKSLKELILKISNIEKELKEIKEWLNE